MKAMNQLIEEIKGRHYELFVKVQEFVESNPSAEQIEQVFSWDTKFGGYAKGWTDDEKALVQITMNHNALPDYPTSKNVKDVVRPKPDRRYTDERGRELLEERATDQAVHNLGLNEIPMAEWSDADKDAYTQECRRIYSLLKEVTAQTKTIE